MPQGIVPRALVLATLLVPFLVTGLARASAQSSDQDPVIPVGGAFELVNHRGETVTEQSFPGKFLLVFFGYTFCPDICPTTLQQVTTALDSLGEGADRIQPLFITVDPDRDTPEVLNDYVAHFHPGIVGLTGTTEQVAAAAKAFRAGFSKVPSENGPEDYLVHHSAFLYLMGPRLMGPGRDLRAMMMHIMAPETMAGIIRKQLDKSS